MFTPEDLDRARKELRQWQEKFADYSGNNPNKFQADIRAALRKVRDIEECLKAAGAIPVTEQERLELELDHLFPDAQSKQIAEHNGRRFQRRFFPLEKSRSGKTVTRWQRSWVDVTDEAP